MSRHLNEGCEPVKANGRPNDEVVDDEDVDVRDGRGGVGGQGVFEPDSVHGNGQGVEDDQLDAVAGDRDADGLDLHGAVDDFGKDAADRRADAANPLQPFRAHIVSVLPDDLEELIDVPKDIVQLMVLLCLVAGRLKVPFHLEIVTSTQIADLAIIRRIFNIFSDEVRDIDTFEEFRALERGGFNDISIIFVRNESAKLFGRLVACAAGSALGPHPVCLIRVTTQKDNSLGLPGVLRLMADQADRDLDAFGGAFALPFEPADEDQLAELRRKLTPTLPPARPVCGFRRKFYATIDDQGLMLIVERLLVVFAIMRVNLSIVPRDDYDISVYDYLAVRALLISLPLMPTDRRLSADALAFAGKIHCTLRDDEKAGRELPDRSDEGDGWFTRNDAKRWRDVGYTTAKKYLGQLEGSGIMTSTVALVDRVRGKDIFYRFDNGQQPPFAWPSPFAGLPDIEDEMER